MHRFFFTAFRSTAYLLYLPAKEWISKSCTTVLQQYILTAPETLARSLATTKSGRTLDKRDEHELPTKQMRKYASVPCTKASEGNPFEEDDKPVTCRQFPSGQPIV